MSTVAIKVVLLGNSGVGKTSLISRWVTGSWQANLKPTVGTVNLTQRVTINQTEVQVILWDTAGQEQFSTLAPLYVRSACVVILTASFSDETSFERLDYWMNLVKETCDANTPVILAVNKKDLQESCPYTIDEIDKKYNPIYHNIFYVSAQSGENVDLLFNNASEIGYDFYISHNQSDMQQKELPQENKQEKCSC